MGFELTLPLPFWTHVVLSMPGTALEHDMNRCIHARMNPIDKTRRVITNLPITLLKEACQVSGAGITEYPGSGPHAGEAGWGGGDSAASAAGCSSGMAWINREADRVAAPG